MNRYIELLLQAEREENFQFITEAPQPLPNPFFSYLLHKTRAHFQRTRFQQTSYKNSLYSALQSELYFLLMVKLFFSQGKPTITPLKPGEQPQAWPKTAKN